MTPVVALLPLALCMLPFYIPAAAFAQLRARRFGIEKDSRWGLRLATGVLYGVIQWFLLGALHKHWQIDINRADVFLLSFFGILGTTFLGMLVCERIWQSVRQAIYVALRRLYGVEHDHELPPQRMLEAAEWVFFLELPALVALTGAGAIQLLHG